LQRHGAGGEQCTVAEQRFPSDPVHKGAAHIPGLASVEVPFPSWG
jgi:hypothetical protein